MDEEKEKPILYIGANHPNLDSVVKEFAKNKDYEVCIVDEIKRNFVNYNIQIPDKGIENSEEFSKPINSNKHKNTLIKNKNKRRNKKKRK